MDKIEQFKNLYESIKKEPVYIVQYKSTGEVVGYKPAPELLIGRIPIYEKKYIVKELSLTNKEDLFSLLIVTYGKSVFSNKEDAFERANWLNEHENELDMDDYFKW